MRLFITWQFNMLNAIFSSLFTVIVVAAVLWVKLKRQRLAIEGAMNELRHELAPLSTALQQIAGGFLTEKINELEATVERLDVRMQHLEELIEASQRR